MNVLVFCHIVFLIFACIFIFPAIINKEKNKVSCLPNELSFMCKYHTEVIKGIAIVFASHVGNATSIRLAVPGGFV